MKQRGNPALFHDGGAVEWQGAEPEGSRLRGHATLSQLHLSLWTKRVTSLDRAIYKMAKESCGGA